MWHERPEKINVRLKSLMLEIKFQKTETGGGQIKGHGYTNPNKRKKGGRYESVTLFHLGCFAKTAKL